MHETTPDRSWPSSIDDLRAEPGRLVFESDLRRLRIIKHHGMIKRLPKPLRVPAEPNGWEARTILRALGIDLGGPSGIGSFTDDDAQKVAGSVVQVSNDEHAHRAAQGKGREPFTVSFTDPEFSQVAALADQLDIPPREVVRRAIAEFVAKHRGRPPQSDGGLDDRR